MSEEKPEAKKLMPIGKIVSWYWKVFGKYRLQFFVGFLLYGIGIVCVDILPPIVYKNIVDIISGESSVGRDGVWFWLAILGALFFAQYVTFRIGDFFYFFSQSRAQRDLACFTFEKLQLYSYKFFADRFSGSLVSQARRFVEGFSDLQDTAAFSLWMNGLTLLGTFFGIFFFSPLLAVFFLFGIAVISLATIPLLKRRWKYNDLESEEDSKVTGRFSDMISNVLTVKVFSGRERENVSFREYADRQERARSEAWKSFILVSAVQNGLAMLLQISGLSFSVWLWYHGRITAGTVVLVQTYLLNIFGIMWQLTRSASQVLRTSAAATEMIEIFETPIDILDPETPEADRMKDGRIEFRDVSFKYSDGENVFTDFSLEIKDGEKVGIVGPSGAGKTTVTKLLLRFADPQSGSITIDGQDIRSVRQDELRCHIAYVPQEPMLFHRSIRENIAYGKPEASDEDVVMAAKKAEAHDFIMRLPEGYETLVGERGVKLSGGERQRVAIARALLKDAEILVLDEATSSLDSESEHAIQEALDDLMLGKTAVVIAHRLSTIRKLDRIIVLNNDGKIEEEGKHDELLAKNGLYASFWNRQTGSFLDEGEEG